MKKVSRGERSFNRISQMPVLKKLVIRDIIITSSFFLDLPKSRNKKGEVVVRYSSTHF
jgi:hypothetical protein